MPKTDLDSLLALITLEPENAHRISIPADLADHPEILEALATASYRAALPVPPAPPIQPILDRLWEKHHRRN